MVAFFSPTQLFTFAARPKTSAQALRAQTYPHKLWIRRNPFHAIDLRHLRPRRGNLDPQVAAAAFPVALPLTVAPVALRGGHPPAAGLLPAAEASRRLREGWGWASGRFGPATALRVAPPPRPRPRAGEWAGPEGALGGGRAHPGPFRDRERGRAAERAFPDPVGEGVPHASGPGPRSR